MIAITVLLTAASALQAADAGAEPLSLDDQAVITRIPLLARGAEADARPIAVGAFCPARPGDPMREASTFGAGALLMWVLSRRRAQRTTA